MNSSPAVHCESEPVLHLFAPGRLCILGEHQDYLGLSVISGAMNLGLNFEVFESSEPGFRMDLRDISQTRWMSSSRIVSPLPPRDYLQSCINVMLQAGARYQSGYIVRVSGNLPLQKGVSSSSALCTGWIQVLARLSTPPLNFSSLEIAGFAFRAEVLNFDEPGGMQDHVASVLGGVIHMDFANGRDQPILTRVQIPKGQFYLVDTRTVKDTIGMIASIKSEVSQAIQGNWGRDLGPDIAMLNMATVSDVLSYPGPGASRLRATLINRNLVRHCMKRLQMTPPLSGLELGRLMTTHHQMLSHHIGSSTREIDTLVSRAVSLGAWGGKVIGSGGGGCMIVFGPQDNESLPSTLEHNGFEIQKVSISKGVTILRDCLSPEDDNDAE